MGWADILIQMSRYFPAFVARDGTQNLPMIGLISRRMQCIYVDRERKNGPSEGVSAQVKERMIQTQQQPELELRPMLLFPEGTTSNGQMLLPFKTGAFLAGVPVLPVIIKYQGARPGSRVSPCWESITAPQHLLLVMCEPGHSVVCYELPLYKPSPEEAKDPRLLADNVREYMLKHSKLLPSNSTLEDKRDYQAQLKAAHSTPEAKAVAAAEKRQWRIATAVAAIAAMAFYAGLAVAVSRVGALVKGVHGEL